MSEVRAEMIERFELADPSTTASHPWLHALRSRFFVDGLQEQRAILAFTTYQTDNLFFVGRKPDDVFSVFERTYHHGMGMWASADVRTLLLSTRFQIWSLKKAPAQVVPFLPNKPGFT